MKYCPTLQTRLAPGAAPIALALLGVLACNSSPRINASAQGGSTGSGRGGAGGGNTPGGSDASVGGVVLPEVGSASGGTSGTSDGGGGGVDERQCGLEMFTLERLPPDLMLVLDRSSSMRDRPPGNPDPAVTLWTETIAALDEVVMKTHTGVNWGLQMFPQPIGCQVAAAPEVGVAVNNYNMVLGIPRAAGPAMASGTGGGTPTGPAMDATVAYLKTVSSKNPKYVVLATDGRPTCPTTGDADQAAVNAVTAANAAGYKTYVIGIAITQSATMTLNRLANAGGVPRNDPAVQFYPVASRADLVTALTAITGQVSNCVFPLSKPPPVPENVKVTVSGERINSDATNGWSYTANNAAIQFNGATCEKVKTMPGSVEIVFGCPNVVIP